MKSLALGETPRHPSIQGHREQGAKATIVYVRLRTVEQMWRLTVTLRLPCSFPKPIPSAMAAP